jgi:hypothetical protein
VNVHTHPYLAAFWLVVIAAKIILLYFALTRTSHIRCQFFTIYLVCSVLRSVLLVGASWFLMGWTYTWILWFGSGVLHAFAFATAYHCFRYLFYPYYALPRSFLAAFVMVLLALSIGVMAISSFGIAPESSLMAELYATDRTLIWWICALYWMVSIGSDWFGMHWNTRLYGIGLGFLFMYTVDVFVSGMRGLVGGFVARALWPIGLTAELITVCLWIYYFTRKEHGLVSPDVKDLDELESLAELFRKASVVRGLSR